MSPIFSRYAAQNLRQALDDSPATLIHGPRQCGKTTLALDVGKDMEYDYLSFDDEVVRSGAKADPIGFVQDLPKRIILDEVQYVPELFSVLKLEIDRNRQPGRFILTGSTNILLLPTLSDSLAGRMDILRLHPIAQCEIEGQPSGFLKRLFNDQFKSQTVERLGDKLIQRIVSGGYPAALHRTSTNRRAAWYRDYLDTLVQRDVRDLARIGSLNIMPRLLTGVAGQTARLMNVSDLASPFQVSRPTIKEYVSLLTRVFLLNELPPWHNNRLSRLVKTPILHMGDTGTCCSQAHNREGVHGPAKVTTTMAVRRKLSQNTELCSTKTYNGGQGGTRRLHWTSPGRGALARRPRLLRWLANRWWRRVSGYDAPPTEGCWPYSNNDLNLSRFLF